MLLTIEKVIFLKSVDIFSKLPEESLVEVATNLKELDISAEQQIFKKGDFGSSMYIIASGKVRLHDGERTFAILEEKQVFGLLAALDPESRVVTATAVEETHLFRIDQEPLYDLISDSTEIARGIIHFLCQRLRQKH